MCAARCGDFQYEFASETDEDCAYQDDDGCYIIFSSRQNLGQNETVIIRKEKSEFKNFLANFFRPPFLKILFIYYLYILFYKCT